MWWTMCKPFENKATKHPPGALAYLTWHTVHSDCGCTSAAATHVFALLSCDCMREVCFVLRVSLLGGKRQKEHSVFKLFILISFLPSTFSTRAGVSTGIGWVSTNNKAINIISAVSEECYILRSYVNNKKSKYASQKLSIPGQICQNNKSWCWADTQHRLVSEGRTQARDKRLT